MVVPFPVMYLVNEWITILAPCAIGLSKAGVAMVLSTIKGTFAALACALIPLSPKRPTWDFPMILQKMLWYWAELLWQNSQHHLDQQM